MGRTWCVTALLLLLAVSLCAADLPSTSSPTSPAAEDVMATAEDPARNLACLLKYGSIAATDYCLCVAGVTDNFACNYDCSCDVLGLQCHASTCQLSGRMIGLLVFAVFASLVGVGSCVALCCYLSRNRRRHTNYYIVQHTSTELPVYEPHHHHHHVQLQHQPSNY